MLLRKSILLPLAVSLFFWLLQPSALAAEQTTDQMLIKVEQKLNQLEILRQRSLEDLQVLNSQLAISQQELSAAKAQLQTLKAQLAELKQTSKNQESSLKKYEEYCRKLEAQKSKPVLTEYSLKADAQSYISGIGFGKYFRFFNAGYIGGRAEYDWKEQQFNIWLSYMN